MKKTGIFYGSSTGYTADLANRIAKALGVDMADVHDVANTAPSQLGDYDVILLGSSTWGSGDVQPDMEDFIDGASSLSLRGKQMGFFGCGDEQMTDTFCNAVGEMYHKMADTGATFIAPYDASGYHFNHSGAKVDGTYIGLVVDEVNHPELTDGRIAAWTEKIKEAAE